MHDIRLIRDTPDVFDAGLARLGHAAMSAEILSVDEARRAAIAAAEAALAARNAASKEVGAAKAKGDEAEFQRLRALVAAKKDEIAALEEQARLGEARLRDLLMGLPNLPLDEVPDGADETANVEIRRWGTPRVFDFTPVEHFELAAARGHGFRKWRPSCRGRGSWCCRGRWRGCTGRWRSSCWTCIPAENGLIETNTPVLVRDEAMYGTNQLPKFAEDSYQTTNGWWLIPTSEVTLTNMVAGELLDEAALPIRRCAHTPVLSVRSRVGGQGHVRHAAPAPVREGRDGVGHARPRRRWRNMSG